mgnify:CR=1 FL=1
MPEQILETVRRMAADVLGVPATLLSEASGPDSVEEWDSVAHLNLIMAIEDQFQVTFSPEEMESICTLGDLARLVGRQVN